MMRSRVTLPASRTARGPAKRETLHSSVDSVGSTRMSQRSGSADSGPVRNAVRPPGWERRPQLCRRRLREPGKAASGPRASGGVRWSGRFGCVPGARDSAGVAHTAAVPVLVSRAVLAARRCCRPRRGSLRSHAPGAPERESRWAGTSRSRRWTCFTVWPTENWEQSS